MNLHGTPLGQKLSRTLRFMVWVWHSTSRLTREMRGQNNVTSIDVGSAPRGASFTSTWSNPHPAAPSEFIILRVTERKDGTDYVHRGSW